RWYQNAIPRQRAAERSGGSWRTEVRIENHIQRSGAVVHPDDEVVADGGSINDGRAGNGNESRIEQASVRSRRDMGGSADRRRRWIPGINQEVREDLRVVDHRLPSPAPHRSRN